MNLSPSQEIDLTVVNPLLGVSINYPSYATEGSAGLDIHACLVEPLLLKAGESIKIGCGFALHIKNPNLCGQLVPRSGLATKHGIILSNTVGIIDSDYTGEVIVPVMNISDKGYIISPNDRICQLLLVRIERYLLKVVESLDLTARQNGGFGSTGY